MVKIEEIELKKYCVIKLWSSFICIDIVFYKRGSDIFKLLYSEVEETAKREDFFNILAKTFLQFANLGDEKYSPPLIKGKICEEYGKEITVEDCGRKYHFERSSEEEIKEKEKIAKKFEEIIRS